MVWCPPLFLQAARQAAACRGVVDFIIDLPMGDVNEKKKNPVSLRLFL